MGQQPENRYYQLVGDYHNPILQPWAAAVVKRFGDISLSGITYPNASDVPRAGKPDF